MHPYDVVRVKDDPEAYRKFTEDWWKWVYEPDCDAKSDRGDVTFMRDDSIGGPEDPGDNIQEIYRKEGTNIFFPIYHVHICEKDPHPKGGKCDTAKKRKEAADDDLAKIERIWATISKDDGPAVPITTNYNDHAVTFPEFELTVGPNNLNREPQYHLEPGPHTGVASGTYILLKNFKKGKYVLDFGGLASNFKSRSVYTMHVT